MKENFFIRGETRYTIIDTSMGVFGKLGSRNIDLNRKFSTVDS